MLKILVPALMSLSMSAFAQNLNSGEPANWIVGVNDATFSNSASFTICATAVCETAAQHSPIACQTLAAAGAIKVNVSQEVATELANFACVEEVRLEGIFNGNPLVIRRN